jgi:hypothetical protein
MHDQMLLKHKIRIYFQRIFFQIEGLNMPKAIRAGFVSMVSVAMLVGTMSVMAEMPASSYQKTCKEVKVEGNMLKASCQKMDQSWMDTSITINGLANLDGALTYETKCPMDSTPAGSFDKTCKDMSIEADGVTLKGECQKKDQSWMATSIAISNIANIDGQLKYEDCK